MKRAYSTGLRLWVWDLMTLTHPTSREAEVPRQHGLHEHLWRLYNMANTMHLGAQSLTFQTWLAMHVASHS